jgi:hypothetical protein
MELADLKFLFYDFFPMFLVANSFSSYCCAFYFMHNFLLLDFLDEGALLQGFPVYKINCLILNVKFKKFLNVRDYIENYKYS